MEYIHQDLMFSKIISGGKLFVLMQNGAWRHFVAMVTQILVKNFYLSLARH